MENPFFDRPIINSPYQYPSQHWELDEDGQPTQQIIDSRRGAEFVTPIPKPRQRGRARGGQQQFVIDEGLGLSTQDQQYDVTAAVNEIRRHVDQWRNIPGPNNWGVTPETARLLIHWRQHNFSHYRPFFCQIEAVETLIWLTEVAPRLSSADRRVLDRLVDVNQEANPELSRIALKLATGAGKTTVMAMIIAWQTINAVRHPNSRRFTRGFLVVTPGLTIKDRLRVLQPNDPDSYYASRELVPGDMLEDLQRAKIVITNYHALRLRERLEVSSGGRALLQGPGQPLETLESEGQMVQRVMPELMAMKNVMALNDEGHHCYRRKPGEEDERPLTAEERQEATKNSEEARVWLSGLEMVNRKLGVRQVVDLSATPFFLRGSGYAEGTLFPWTVSDFSLMDAIECGIVKLPRVPVADNIPGEQVAGVPQPVGAHQKRYATGRVEAGRGTWTHSTCPPHCRRRWKPSTGTTRLPTTSGRRTAPRFRPASSWSATTLRLPSWCMTSSPALSWRTKTAQPLCRMAGWSCSVTLMSTATVTPYPGPC